MLKKIGLTVASLIGGFIAGIIISEMIVFISYFMLGQSSWLRGLKYMPFIMAALCACAVWIWVPAGKRKHSA